MKRTPAWILLTILLSLMLISCSPQTAPTEADPSTGVSNSSGDSTDSGDAPSSDTDSAYPAPGTGDSAYPTGAGEGQAILDNFDLVNTVPETPGNGTSTVTGTLLYEGEGNPPYASLNLYLGIVLNASDGSEIMARVDPTSAPRAQADINGYFVFTDVPPGRYIVVVRLPPDNLVKLNDSLSGENMILDLVENTITDLGSMTYDFGFPGIETDQ